MSEDSYKHAKHGVISPELEAELAAEEAAEEAARQAALEAAAAETQAEPEVVEVEEAPAQEQSEPEAPVAEEAPSKRPLNLMDMYQAKDYERVLAFAGLQMSQGTPAIASVLFGGFAKAHLTESDNEAYSIAKTAYATALELSCRRGGAALAQFVNLMPVGIYLSFTVDRADAKMNRIDDMIARGENGAASAAMKTLMNGRRRDASVLNAAGISLCQAMAEHQVYDMGSLALLKLMLANVRAEQGFEQGTAGFKKAAEQLVFEAIMATDPAFAAETEAAANAKTKAGKKGGKGSAKKGHSQVDVKAAWSRVPNLADVLGSFEGGKVVGAVPNPAAAKEQ